MSRGFEVGGCGYTPDRRNRREKKSLSPNVIKGAAGIAVLALTLVYGERVCSVYMNSRDTLKGPVADLLKEKGPEKDHPESFKPGELIPEDERSGQNILIAAHPDGKFSSAESGYKTYFNDYLKSFLDALPKGTNVHIVIADDNKDLCLNIAKEIFPHLNFSILEMPYSGRGLEFIQDNVFASGTTDAQGKFSIAKSHADKEEFERDTDCRWESAWWQGMSTNEKAEYALRMFVDDFLGKRHPDKFSTTDVNLRFDGGDMYVTRLPDGKTALIIGGKTIADNLVLLKDECPPYQFVGTISRTNARYHLAGIKRQFKDRFGVDEVIVLDEDQIMYGSSEENGHSKNPDSVMHPLFFHTDMVVKTATSPTGEHIAFCTDYDPEKLPELAKTLCDMGGCYGPNGKDIPLETTTDRLQEMLEYLERVQAQFRDLGYKVVKLPCGSSAVLNYTNSVMFTDENGVKVVIVPQYGIPEDAVAVEEYKKAGFKVLAASYADFVKDTNAMSDHNNLLHKMDLRENADAGMNANGSWHCRSVVLGSSLPTPKKAEPQKEQKERKQPIKELKAWKKQHVAPNQHAPHKQQAQKNPNSGNKKKHIPKYSRQNYSPRD